MKVIQRRCSLIAVFAGVVVPALVFGHGANFQIGAVNNQIVTTHYFLAPNEVPSENYDPYYSGQSVRVADAPMVQDTLSGVGSGTGHNAINNNGWYGQPDLNYLESQGSTESQVVSGGTAFTGPGVAWGADGNGFTIPTGGSITVTETLSAPLQLWSGSSFSNCTTEQLEGIRGAIGGLTAASLYSPLPAGYTPATSNESNSWSSNKTSINSDTHNQVEWRLDAINGTNGTETPDLNPAEGIYLATLTASITEFNSDGSVNDAIAPSLPFYVLFEKDNTDGSFDPSFQSQMTAADAYVASLVPEPTGLAPLTLTGLAARRRRFA